MVPSASPASGRGANHQEILRRGLRQAALRCRQRPPRPPGRAATTTAATPHARAPAPSDTPALRPPHAMSARRGSDALSGCGGGPLAAPGVANSRRQRAAGVCPRAPPPRAARASRRRPSRTARHAASGLPILRLRLLSEFCGELRTARPPPLARQARVPLDALPPSCWRAAALAPRSARTLPCFTRRSSAALVETAGPRRRRRTRCGSRRRPLPRPLPLASARTLRRRPLAPPPAQQRHPPPPARQRGASRL